MRRPSLVEQAVALAESQGFKYPCLDEVGELLHVLSGNVRTGKIAEIGTGYGVSTAWISSATTLPVFTVDNSQTRVNTAFGLFSVYSHIHPVLGDWEQVLLHGPFRLVFVDAEPAKLEGMDKVINATEVGGLIVIDDLTPVEFWPDEWQGKPDLVRDSWLNHGQLCSIEIRTSLKVSVILARRIL